MSDWKRLLHSIGADVEEVFDQLRYDLSDLLETGKPVMILPYRGYGTSTSLFLKGRVLEDLGLRASTDNDTLWDNMLAAYRRIESDEIPHVRVQARCGDVKTAVTADEEGFFTIEVAMPEGLPSGEHTVALSLPDEVRGQRGITATGTIVVPPENATFGIISDVDDTILKTDATNLLNAARLTFTGNARTRQPFDGVASFYRALQSGPDGAGNNPIFYVSSGPWNLYDLLVEFMAQNEIPVGPIFLQNYGLDIDTFIHKDHLTHKAEAIARLLDAYPGLPFILIGDSGQKDPEVYRTIVDRYPGRIAAIYIRDVSVDTRDQEVIAIADDLRLRNVPMILAADSAAAMADAKERGWVNGE